MAIIKLQILGCWAENPLRFTQSNEIWKLEFFIKQKKKTNKTNHFYPLVCYHIGQKVHGILIPFSYGLFVSQMNGALLSSLLFSFEGNHIVFS